MDTQNPGCKHGGRLKRAVLLMAFILLIGVLTGQFSRAVSSAAAAEPSEKTKSETAEGTGTINVPGDLSDEGIHELLAQLGDDQVRRLLIAELKKRAKTQQSTQPPKEEMGFLAEFIGEVKQKAGSIQERIEHLKSGAAVRPEDIPENLRRLTEGKQFESLGRVFAGIFLLFAAGAAGHLLFSRATAHVRKKMETLPEDLPWTLKLWHLLWQAALDAGSLFVFIAITLILFFVFFDKASANRLVLVAYLAALVITGAAHMLSRLILAPKTPALRFLPLTTETAFYLNCRFQWISAIGIFGWLTCGIFRVQGTSEATHLTMVALIGLVLVLMLIRIVLSRKDAAREALIKDLPENSPRMRMAQKWHQLAVGYLLVFWLAWTVALVLIGRKAVMPAAALLLSVPLFWALDWLLQRILALAFGISNSHSRQPAGVGTEAADSDSKPAAAGHLEIHRMQSALSRALRFVLAMLIFIWVLGVWGIRLPLGLAVVQGAFSIIVTLLVSYVFWALINVPIERKLREEMHAEDEEMEEGGSGGSHIGTLLLLLRKFLFSVIAVMVTLVVLSSIGVDIGPLIAGAGVVGLAIGFGAQTLVKDIIAGGVFPCGRRLQGRGLYRYREQQRDGRADLNSFLKTPASPGYGEHHPLWRHRIGYQLQP